MNLVAECTTMSAPHSSGRIRYGVGTVLSTISGMPCSWATPATPSMSRTSFFGLRQRLAEERLGVRADRGPPLVEVVGVVDERDLDAQLGQRVVEEVVGAAVQRRRRHDVVAGLGQVEDRQRLGRLARLTARAPGCRRPCAAALERGDARLEHGLGRVHDPGVDVADLGQREQVGRVLGVAELVAGGLVDRHGPGAGGRVGLVRRRGSGGSRSPSVSLMARAAYVARKSLTEQVGFSAVGCRPRRWRR